MSCGQKKKKEKKNQTNNNNKKKTHKGRECKRTPRHPSSCHSARHSQRETGSEGTLGLYSVSQPFAIWCVLQMLQVSWGGGKNHGFMIK